MNKINKGKIVGNTYVKYVNWNKAVVWKYREISIHKDVAENWLTNEIKFIKFIDKLKKKSWIANLNRIKDKWELKRIGQEPQYYFSIDLFNTVKSLLPSIKQEKQKEIKEQIHQEPML